MKTDSFKHEDRLVQEIKQRLKNAGETVWQRFPLPWTHPSFKSCVAAARNLLNAFNTARTFLVMRDQCLHPVRVDVVQTGKVLIIPTRSGDALIEIPGTCLYTHRIDSIPAVRINPAPPGARPYTGHIDAIVVSCLAFNRFQRRLYTFELEKTAHVLSELRDGLSNGWRLPPAVPVVAVAADEQEVEGWPDSAQGFVEADLVATPTRVVALGSGETVGISAGVTEEKVEGKEVGIGQVSTSNDRGHLDACLLGGDGGYIFSTQSAQMPASKNRGTV